MLNKELVQRKINKIEIYTEELQPILKLTPSEILSDYTKLRTVERNFQLMVDTVIDINTHIISQDNLRAPEDATDTFHVLEKVHVLPMEFVQKFSPVVGLRNKIVHDYEDINVEKLINDIKTGVSQFGEYAVYIDVFMKKR
ncbi:MAG: hypothetical protein US25_C0002G0006 [Candidatus Moranbacteria bacterium GW2011_GWE1_36_7]|nr:MAG: hypothetical protein UR99_C0011G0006 [Candidatus Moranbacteria bacterium GW2011_GWD2_36_12]KKQ06594.1 MAG: hypothetical protein US16_C0013G0006 [Candidatus Moranbacteria bacterium GW2011_GWE2_36_40]KKQ15539.1 MAG: hypothetical protein US25_C0002G0006 [Candidatus Moranbacteria bacterium GW2011_GWE1_36_7]